MQETTPNTETPAAADPNPNVEVTPAVAPITASDAAPSPRRSGVRAIGVATLVGAIGIGAIAVAIVAGGPRNDAAPAADGLASRGAPLGAVSEWAAPATTDDVRLDRGGRGGMRGAMGGAISITAIDGTKLALKTDNGWTRTIDTSGATVTKDGATVALSTLVVGDRIVFRETRNDDGTFTITAIEVIQPAVSGTVAAVSGSAVTVTQRDGSTSKVVLTASTTYKVAGQASTKDAVVTGAQIVARGTLATDGTLTATSVEVAPATTVGTVKEKGASSLTLTTRDGSTIVVKVTSTTTYQVDGITSPTLADVKVGDVVMTAGTRNADGSLSATVVRSHAAGQFGGPGDQFGGPGDGFGGGPGDRFGHGGMPGDGRGWGFPGGPNASPAPSTAPSGSGTNG